MVAVLTRTPKTPMGVVPRSISGKRSADRFPEIDLGTTPMGVFGVRVKTATTTVLHPGDRVELYRSLIADPKENRRTRAESQKLGHS